MVFLNKKAERLHDELVEIRLRDSLVSCELKDHARFVVADQPPEDVRMVKLLLKLDEHVDDHATSDG
jgi:uncharacterized Zn finger protein